MEKLQPTRVQLCGRFVIETGSGRRVEPSGRQARMLLGYLVLHRNRPASRAEIIDAVWGTEPAPAADSALSALLSKVRHALGWEIAGRGEVRLRVPAGTIVDAETAIENVHLGEAALRRGELGAAYFCALTARYIAQRSFLAGCDAVWIDDWRRDLAGVHIRALECFTQACLLIGGGELVAAQRANGELVELAPYRESAHALRMRALISGGNTAEALLAYDGLRHRLRDELGVDPGPELRALYQELLTATAPSGGTQT